LRDIGVPYEVVSTSAEESLESESAADLAAANAVAKVRQAALPPGDLAGVFVLGTDTLVTLAGRVMGKPASRAEAAAMIAALSGHTHQVISGVALRRIGEENAAFPAAVAGDRGVGGQLHVATATTDVTFLRLNKVQIDAYIALGEWTDKAGAYGIQGLAGTFVCEIRGEYSNVVGLPLCLLAHLFREAGFDLLRRQWI
jgi:septum formation protein